MNVRRCTLKNAKGGTFTYLQLVHNYRVKGTGKTNTQVLMKLGRENQIGHSSSLLGISRQHERSNDCRADRRSCITQAWSTIAVYRKGPYESGLCVAIPSCLWPLYQAGREGHASYRYCEDSIRISSISMRGFAVTFSIALPKKVLSAVERKAAAV